MAIQLSSVGTTTRGTFLSGGSAAQLMNIWARSAPGVTGFFAGMRTGPINSRLARRFAPVLIVPLLTLNPLTPFAFAYALSAFVLFVLASNFVMTPNAGMEPNAGPLSILGNWPAALLLMSLPILSGIIFGRGFLLLATFILMLEAATRHFRIARWLKASMLAVSSALIVEAGGVAVGAEVPIELSLMAALLVLALELATPWIARPAAKTQPPAPITRLDVPWSLHRWLTSALARPAPLKRLPAPSSTGPSIEQVAFQEVTALILRRSALVLVMALGLSLLSGSMQAAQGAVLNLLALATLTIFLIAIMRLACLIEHKTRQEITQDGFLAASVTALLAASLSWLP